MSCSKITPDLFFWKVSFSSDRNCLDGSIFFVVSLLLYQFIDFKAPHTQSSVSSNDPPFSFNSVGLFDLTTPFPIAITIWWLAAVPANPCSNHNDLHFFIRLSESRFGRPFFLKIIFPSLSFFIFIFQFVDGCSNESVLWINFNWTVQLLLWFREAVRNFQPLFWLFRDYFCCSTFWFACFFFNLLSTIFLGTHQMNLPTLLKFFHEVHRFELIETLLTIKWKHLRWN